MNGALCHGCDNKGIAFIGVISVYPSPWLINDSMTVQGMKAKGANGNNVNLFLSTKVQFSQTQGKLVMAVFLSALQVRNHLQAKKLNRSYFQQDMDIFLVCKYDNFIWFCLTWNRTRENFLSLFCCANVTLKLFWFIGHRTGCCRLSKGHAFSRKVRKWSFLLAKAVVCTNSCLSTSKRHSYAHLLLGNASGIMPI